MVSAPSRSARRRTDRAQLGGRPSRSQLALPTATVRVADLALDAAAGDLLDVGRQGQVEALLVGGPDHRRGEDVG